MFVQKQNRKVYFLHLEVEEIPAADKSCNKTKLNIFIMLVSLITIRDECKRQLG